MPNQLSFYALLGLVALLGVLFYRVIAIRGGALYCRGTGRVVRTYL